MADLSQAKVNGTLYQLKDAKAREALEEKLDKKQDAANAGKFLSVDADGSLIFTEGSGTGVKHEWKGTTLEITSESGTSSADLKGEKGDNGDTGATGPQGEPGEKGETGAPGKDGMDCTHEWNGTELTITSASGTSSADLKGEKGDAFTYADFTPEQLAALKGEKGDAGGTTMVDDETGETYKMGVRSGGLYYEKIETEEE